MSFLPQSSSPLTPEQQRCVTRWSPLFYHPIQEALVTDLVRFKVVPAGRRSGKTERAKRYMARMLMASPNRTYFLAAPTHKQVKRIFWEDMKLLCFAPLLDRSAVSEGDLIIRYPNGSSLHLIGLDKPQRVEGTYWSGGIIDEIADIKASAWPENIKPALDTLNPSDPEYRPWCWLIGTPDGLNHYYDLAEKARLGDNPNWKLYTWSSEDILPPDAIEEAKRDLSPRQYRQEYLASFETARGRIYPDYNDGNCVTAKIRPHEQLHWFHDFNYSPLSSGIGVKRNKGRDFYLLDEIVLTSAVARQSAVEFVDKYRDHKNRKVILFGDPAGKAGEPHGQSSNYTEIENYLKAHNWEVERRVKAAAPAIRDRQNSLRAKIENAHGEKSLFVNPILAPYCHKGLSTVQFKEGSAFQEEEKNEYQHITTAIGYCTDYEWPALYRKEPEIVIPHPTLHRWPSNERR